VLAQMEDVLESLNDGVMVADLKSSLLTMNQKAMAMHGFAGPRAPLDLADFHARFELFDLQDRPLPRGEWPLPRVSRGERFADYEVGFRPQAAGSAWIASYCGAPVCDGDGVPILAIITLRDISEKKRLEEQGSLLQAQLEAFNHTLSHDLRQPLNAVSSYCQALRDLGGEQLDARCKGYLQEIYEGALRMGRLIDARLERTRP